AEIENYIGKNPLHRLPGLKMSPGRIDYLSQQEILQLLRGNSTEECYPLILVALNTGLRIGELTGLCWDRVNFQTNMIEVSRSLTRSGLANTTKTNLIRYIPMNNEVRDCLEDLLKKQKGPQFVFTDPKGNHYNPDHFSQRKFQQALDRVGVRRVHFHILRHTYASHFMMNGGNIYDLQKILGHTKVDMTMKYAHLSPQHLNRAVETVRFSAEGGDRGHSPFLSPRENNNSRLKVV
ncbi:MAG: tyrosine-type recombinase/integrase, partial [Pseudobdellovibrionaceae bacterium]